MATTSGKVGSLSRLWGAGKWMLGLGGAGLAVGGATAAVETATDVDGTGGAPIKWLQNQWKKWTEMSSAEQGRNVILDAYNNGIAKMAGFVGFLMPLIQFFSPALGEKMKGWIVDKSVQMTETSKDMAAQGAPHESVLTPEQKQAVVDATSSVKNSVSNAVKAIPGGEAVTNFVSDNLIATPGQMVLAAAAGTAGAIAVASRRGNAGPATLSSVATPNAAPTAATATEEIAEDVAKAGSRLGRGGKFALGALAVGAATTAVATYATTGTADAAVPPTTPSSADLLAATPAPELTTTESVMLGAMTGEAGLAAAKGGTMLAKEGLEFGAKRIPLIGGIVTAGFAAVAAGRYAWNGEYGRAGAELGTGLVEGLVNTTGLGLLGAGDAAREAIRMGVENTAGAEYAPDKSGLRTIIEYGTGTGDFGPSPETSVNDFKAAVANSPIVVPEAIAEAAAPQAAPEAEYDVMGNATGFAPIALGAGGSMGGSFSSATTGPTAQSQAHDAISTPKPKRTHGRRAQAEAAPGIHVN